MESDRLRLADPSRLRALASVLEDHASRPLAADWDSAQPLERALARAEQERNSMTMKTALVLRACADRIGDAEGTSRVESALRAIAERHGFVYDGAATLTEFCLAVEHRRECAASGAVEPR